MSRLSRVRSDSLKCEKCNSENIRAFIHVQMYIDAKDNNHLTKKVINKKTTELWSQSHDKTKFVCSSCGYAWPIW